VLSFDSRAFSCSVYLHETAFVSFALHGSPSSDATFSVRMQRSVLLSFASLHQHLSQFSSLYRLRPWCRVQSMNGEAEATFLSYSRAHSKFEVSSAGSPADTTIAYHIVNKTMCSTASLWLSFSVNLRENTLTQGNHYPRK